MLVRARHLCEWGNMQQTSTRQPTVGCRVPVAYRMVAGSADMAVVVSGRTLWKMRIRIKV